MTIMTRYNWTADGRRTSPPEYLTTPPLVIRSFTCGAHQLVVDGGHTYVFPAICTLPGHDCPYWQQGRDPGDETG